jgi:hypothetical protein
MSAVVLDSWVFGAAISAGLGVEGGKMVLVVMTELRLVIGIATQWQSPCHPGDCAVLQPVSWTAVL